MQKKIVIASVLKPVDDVRSFLKLSQSIAKTNKYEVNIIGNDSKNAIEISNVKFHRHQVSRNQWANRYFLRFRILRLLSKIKPDLLIITDHELIGVAVISKFIFGCRIIYDVQENYYLNLIGIKPSLLKTSYANLVRLKERLSSILMDKYWLAEQCYARELPFVKGKSLVIENKAFAVDHGPKKNRGNKAIFTGTISDYSKVDLALTCYKKLLQLDSNFTLQIIGQYHHDEVEKYLVNESKKLKGLSFNISKKTIPHSEIVSAITSATLGIISYQPNVVNRYKIPTKLYEYSRYQLPYLVQKDTYWSEIGKGLGGAMPIEFGNPDLEFIQENLKNSLKLFPKAYPREATWEFESKKIINSIKKLIN
ncbi:hypothetical protein [Ekhidna sp.]|uniref:hypothetical protein n=1 Tax=Ekhidna sp. TaxID=2608089 RepID=UPI003BAB99FD